MEACFPTTIAPQLWQPPTIFNRHLHRTFTSAPSRRAVPPPLRASSCFTKPLQPCVFEPPCLSQIGTECNCSSHHSRTCNHREHTASANLRSSVTHSSLHRRKRRTCTSLRQPLQTRDSLTISAAASTSSLHQ
ncbi:hypothetical protein DEO72_LG1g2380 [Vigna unguiculata]|uniref:Uncharacterized protein n=1 Tax=Vigna unguiculata TaxID=3917 RepID=A0A4D6KY44_VIGUN|nr:hypothetical protein DEO72_LG1g2380 [Vigna unguiculata]